MSLNNAVMHKTFEKIFGGTKFKNCWK